MSEVRGDTVVLGLVLSLVAFLFIFWTMLSVNLRPEDRGDLLFPVIRLTHSALMGVAWFVALGAYQAGRNGWWVYLMLGFVPLVQLLAPILWFARTRREPIRMGRIML